MPVMSAEKAADRVEVAGYEAATAQLDDFTVSFESIKEGGDFSPLFQGLPDDACQSPHWGYLLAGEVTYHYTDGSSDVVHAGEAYYVRPGHTPEVADGTRAVEFSPTESLAETMRVVEKNLAEQG